VKGNSGSVGAAARPRSRVVQSARATTTAGRSRSSVGVHGGGTRSVTTTSVGPARHRSIPSRCMHMASSSSSSANTTTTAHRSAAAGSSLRTARGRPQLPTREAGRGLRRARASHRRQGRSARHPSVASRPYLHEAVRHAPPPCLHALYTSARPRAHANEVSLQIARYTVALLAPPFADRLALQPRVFRRGTPLVSRMDRWGDGRRRTG